MKVLVDHDPADWRDCSLCRHYIEAQDADPEYEVVDDLETRAKNEYWFNHTPHGRAITVFGALAYAQHQVGLGHIPDPSIPWPPGYPERFFIPDLRPWVPAMLLCLKRGRPVPEDLVEFIYADPPPSLEAVRERLATLDLPPVEV